MIDWNPWGKPGAGAPPKKTQIVAPITPRTNNQVFTESVIKLFFLCKLSKLITCFVKKCMYFGGDLTNPYIKFHFTKIYLNV